MSDPRVTKLAQVLIQYSLDIQPGQQLMIHAHPLAEELTLAVYEQAIKAGAHVLLRISVAGDLEVFYKYASDAQLEYISPVEKMIVETFDASLDLWADHNTRELSGVDKMRIARSRKAKAPLMQTFFERAARKELKWSLTVYPTQAMAQEADMSLRDYQDFVYNAGMLNLDDPIAFWQEEGRRQQKIVDWLKGKNQVNLKGSNVDLNFSVKDRLFLPCSGKENFPDGEIFTGPVEESATGWIRFSYPAIMYSQEVSDIQLWFENGKVVKETAVKNQELLTSTLNIDSGARYLGEFGIGVNYGIQRFTKNMLFDEKMGGTIHLALGRGYPESGSRNESAIHWDMLCNMNDAEMSVDGETFYKDGKFIE